ncbi:hypothetical protein BKA69DRAFT_1128213 [Paraphysoderma sedebokerense]|nr:hypothetical protein BKA69DRAFT_1128213 [Paraphysoderma sedebokerense]
MSEIGSEANLADDVPALGTYTGDRAPNSNERHGNGSNVFPNGDVYTGAYALGKRHGNGSYVWKKPKAKYAGDYVDNLKHGKGIICYPDGSRYKGDFVTGKRHGYGTYIYPKSVSLNILYVTTAFGDAYVGEFANDLKHGPGTYIFTATQSKQKGTWNNGYLVGEAEIIHADHKIVCNFSAITEQVTNDDGTTAEKIVGSKMQLPVKLVFNGNGYEIQTERMEHIMGIQKVVEVED